MYGCLQNVIHIKKIDKTRPFEVYVMARQLLANILQCRNIYFNSFISMMLVQERY